MNRFKLINVVCGVIYKGDKIFIARRASHKVMAGTWEFPGGKVENNEKERDALFRELMEEFGMKVKIIKRLGEQICEFGQIKIRLIVFECNFNFSNFDLIDHDEIAWVNKKELINYELSLPDRGFINSFGNKLRD